MKNSIPAVKNAMLAVQRYPWEQGVCAQAIYEIGDIRTMIAMAHDAVLRQKPDGRLAVINENIAVTDPAANGEVVWRAYEITGDTFYQKAALRMLDYLLKDAPRTEEGILYHNEISFQEEFTPCQIWADSAYMAPPFLAVMGYAEEAARQIEGYFSYLVDREKKLVNHIYDVGRKTFVREKLWATGNGWTLLGIGRVADLAKEQGKEDVFRRMTELGTKLLQEMLRYQLPDGRFHDILDDENSFIDGTAAMMMAAFIYRGCRHGWLDKQYLQKADLVAETMENYVDDYGIIHEVCGCPDFVSSGTSAESMAAYLMMHGWREG